MRYILDIKMLKSGAKFNNKLIVVLYDKQSIMYEELNNIDVFKDLTILNLINTKSLNTVMI